MKGSIYAICSSLEERKSPFAVSRLIMMTGIQVGKFGPDTPDNPAVLARAWPAIAKLLSKEELEELQALVGDVN